MSYIIKLQRREMRNIEDKKHIIYAHINKSNGKIYIGQSCNDVDTRAGSNGTKYTGCTYFWKAIQKYGWDNFEHIVLVDKLTQAEADVIEKELIIKYDSANPKYGYNSKIGSICNNYKGTVKDYQQNGVKKSVYISKELEEALEKEAAEKGTNFSNLVRMILVEREKDKQK